MKPYETYQCARMFRAGVCGPSDKGGLLMISHDTSENCGMQLTKVAIHLGNIISMLEMHRNAINSINLGVQSISIPEFQTLREFLWNPRKTRPSQRTR